MKRLFAIILLSLGLAGTAQAASVGGNVNGKWLNENGSFYSAISGDTLKWGLFGTSYLYIDDGHFSAPVSLGHNEVKIASLKWFNASSIDKWTPDFFTAIARLTVNWTTPGPASGTEKVRFDITNTKNPAADTIALSVLTGLADFGAPYQLDPLTRVLGYSLFHSGAGSFVNGLWTNPEHGKSYLHLYAHVEVVPLPAAGWLLIAGVGGLAAMARRRKMAA